MNELKKQYMRPQLERNYEKFFTPEHVADFMVELADPAPFERGLEPSAGNGSIVRAIKRYTGDPVIWTCELKEEYKKPLFEAGAYGVYIGDFLDYAESLKFDYCIANPPFDKNTNLQDHFDKIRKFMKVGGRVVMIVPDDFDPKIEHKKYVVANWSKNSDGSTTPIKIISFVN